MRKLKRYRRKWRYLTKTAKRIIMQKIIIYCIKLDAAKRDEKPRGGLFN